jgi:hypothetical protein
MHLLRATIYLIAFGIPSQTDQKILFRYMKWTYWQSKNGNLFVIVIRGDIVYF